MISTTGTSDFGNEHLRRMRQAAQGDPEAFCALCTALSPHILRFLAAHNGHSSAEDVLQETFSRLWQGRERFRGESTVLTFVLAIVANIVREQDAGYPKGHEQSGLFPAVLDALEPEAFDGFHGGEGQDLIERLQRLLAALPSKQREALDLVYYQGLTAAQAARKAGCSPDAFRGRLCRATKTLREQLTVSDHVGPAASSPWRKRLTILRLQVLLMPLFIKI